MEDFSVGFCGSKVGRRNSYRDNASWDCLSVYKKSRFYCPNSKSIREDILEKCFMEAYHLLTANDGLAIEEFIKKVRESSERNATSIMKEKLLAEKNSLKEKLSKIVDLFVEEKIETTIFNKKQTDIQEKIIECDEKIKRINEMKNEDDNFEEKINYIKDKLLSVRNRNMYETFDAELFTNLIDYGIIGGYDEFGNKSSYMIRFICKKGRSSRENITEEIIVNNNNLQNAETSMYNTVLDFIMNENFTTFENIDGRRNRINISEIRVRVEIEK